MVKIEKQVDEQAIDYDPDVPRYPYGTSLRFEDELVAALGLDMAQVGTEMLLTAKVKVTSVSQSKSEDLTSSHKHTCVELQLTDVEVRSESKSPVDLLYGKVGN